MLFMLIASLRSLLLLIAFGDEYALDGTMLATGFGIFIDWHEFLIKNFYSAPSFLFSRLVVESQIVRLDAS